jgi:DNA-binding response OmpR family regulator
MNDSARILVLEDDSNMLELLCEALEDAGYEPRGARAPEQAVEMARTIPFNLMISDIRMAGATDGLGAIGAVKKYQPNIKVVVITGYANEDAPRRAIQLQVDDYVYKPFRIPVMLQSVRRVLDRRYGIFGTFASLKNLLTAPVRLLEQASLKKVEHLVKLLDKEKQRVLQALYVALRAKQMSRSAALEIWDQLEALESQAVQVFSRPNEADLQALGSGYRRVFERIAYFEKTGHVGASTTRQPGQVSRPGFGKLVEQVQSGEVGLDDLGSLLAARQDGDKTTGLQAGLQELLKSLNV